MDEVQLVLSVWSLHVDASGCEQFNGHRAMPQPGDEGLAMGPLLRERTRDTLHEIGGGDLHDGRHPALPAWQSLCCMRSMAINRIYPVYDASGRMIYISATSIDPPPRAGSARRARGTA